MKASQQLIVGKHDIGWISDRFSGHFKDTTFEKRAMPTCQVLQKTMSDSTIESELKPGLCELGDLLTFLESAPEEYRDGKWNLFYFPAFVVDVDWNSDRRSWHVDAWARAGSGWHAGTRVFSPATVSCDTQSGPWDSLSLNPLKYRKKPVEIEVMRFATNSEHGDANMNAICIWINQGRLPEEGHKPTWHNGTNIFIETLEGTMRAECGDWIIKGVKGEFYPCKPDIFAETYELV